MLKPMMRPAMMPAMQMPVPVALSQLKVNTAGSLAFLATTGGTRSTSLCRPCTGNAGAVILLGGVLQVAIEVKTFSGVFMIFLPVTVPQQKTMTLRINQGNQARATSPRLYPCAARRSVLASSPSKVQMRFGCQTIRKAMRQIIEMMAEITSTSHGPWWLETKYCEVANVAPATRIAGQISIISEKPTKAQISQKGTITENQGRIRPAIAPRVNSLNPVTPASAMIGVPKAP